MKKLLLSLLLFPLVACGQAIYTPGIYVGYSPPPAAPAFGGESMRVYDNSGGATTTITLTNGIPQNSRVIVSAVSAQTADVVNSISDTGVNTYGVITNSAGTCGDNVTTCLASANAATALISGNTIVVHWAGSGIRIVSVAYCTGVSALDVACQTGNCNSTSVSAQTSTTAANTIQFGFVFTSTGGLTYSGGSWTSIGPSLSGSGVEMNWVYHISSSAGIQDPLGTLSALTHWACAWAAFK